MSSPGSFSLLWAVLVLFAAACAGPGVETDYDLKTDFNSFSKTWKLWEERQQSECGDLNRDELERNRFYTALDTAMAEKGYIKGSLPALLVTIGYRVGSVVSDEPRVRPGVSIGYGSGGFGFGLGGMFGWGSSSLRHHRQARIVVSVYSAATKKLIWRGSAADSPPATKATPEERNTAARKLVQAVVKDFPPK